ncbi:unnamed protein product [Effrenium voratum]|uniref:Senescence domain-containing protein n=1 Tax=Effrenium voratum TaxID=2562239 RepID=A0AA36N081_9DINO|nr:unnamed protein product [Effrenium voratum]
MRVPRCRFALFTEVSQEVPELVADPLAWACLQAPALADSCLSLGAGALRILPQQSEVLLLFEKEDFFAEEHFLDVEKEAQFSARLAHDFAADGEGRDGRLLAGSSWLVFEAPEALRAQAKARLRLDGSSGRFCAIFFEQNQSSLQRVVDVLLEAGLDVHSVASMEARVAAQDVEDGAQFVAESILATAEAAAWGIRTLGEAVTLLPQNQLEVPCSAKGVVSSAKDVTQSVASAAESVVKQLAPMGHVGFLEQPCTSQRPENARLVGLSSLRAAQGVLQACEDASVMVVSRMTETGTGVVKHLCGHDAGDVFQDAAISLSYILDAHRCLCGHNLTMLPEAELKVSNVSQEVEESDEASAERNAGAHFL